MFLRSSLLACLLVALLTPACDDTSSRTSGWPSSDEVSSSPEAITTSCVYVQQESTFCSFDSSYSHKEPEERCQDHSTCPVPTPDTYDPHDVCRTTVHLTRQRTFDGSCEAFRTLRESGQEPFPTCEGKFSTGADGCDSCLLSYCCEEGKELPDPAEFAPLRDCTLMCWKQYPPNKVYGEDLNEDDREPCLKECRGLYPERPMDLGALRYCQMDSCSKECRVGMRY